MGKKKFKKKKFNSRWYYYILLAKAHLGVASILCTIIMAVCGIWVKIYWSPISHVWNQITGYSQNLNLNFEKIAANVDPLIHNLEDLYAECHATSYKNTNVFSDNTIVALNQNLLGLIASNKAIGQQESVSLYCKIHDLTRYADMIHTYLKERKNICLILKPQKDLEIISKNILTQTYEEQKNHNGFHLFSNYWSKDHQHAFYTPEQCG